VEVDCLLARASGRRSGVPRSQGVTVREVTEADLLLTVITPNLAQ